MRPVLIIEGKRNPYYPEYLDLNLKSWHKLIKKRYGRNYELRVEK